MSSVGLDVGTSRVKAVRFDESWQAADVAAEANVVRRLPGGGREQDMADVWTAAARVLGTVVRRSPDRVDSVAVTAQGDGCWLVDADGSPAAPAMLWNDSRAAGIVEQWQRDGLLEEAFRYSGCQGAPGLAHAQLAWLRRTRPEVLERARTLLSCGSWVYAQLTGRRVLEATEAANPFFDANSRRYEPAVLQLFGLGDLDRLLPEVVSGPDRCSAVRAEIADELGLDRSTPVSLAPYDVPATAIGTGAVREGLAFGVLGTTLCVGVVAGDPRLDRAANGMTLPGTSGDRWLIAYATMIGTEVLDWAAALLGLPHAGAVGDLAATSTRRDLPLVLPYLSAAGERSPFLDISVRGTITGLDAGHTPADVARATVDGLSLVVKECLYAAGTPTRLALSGGGAASELWCQSISDAAGIPVLRPDVAEVGARGAVICASTDAGRYDSLDDAVIDAVHEGQVYEPDAERVEYYEQQYQRFLAARAALTRAGS